MVVPEPPLLQRVEVRLSEEQHVAVREEAEAAECIAGPAVQCRHAEADDALRGGMALHWQLLEHCLHMVEVTDDEQLVVMQELQPADAETDAVRHVNRRQRVRAVERRNNALTSSEAAASQQRQQQHGRSGAGGGGHAGGPKPQTGSVVIQGRRWRTAVTAAATEERRRWTLV